MTVENSVFSFLCICAWLHVRALLHLLQRNSGSVGRYINLTMLYRMTFELYIDVPRLSIWKNSPISYAFLVIFTTFSWLLYPFLSVYGNISMYERCTLGIFRFDIILMFCLIISCGGFLDCAHSSLLPPWLYWVRYVRLFQEKEKPPTRALPCVGYWDGHLPFTFYHIMSPSEAQGVSYINFPYIKLALDSCMFFTFRTSVNRSFVGPNFQNIMFCMVVNRVHLPVRFQGGDLWYYWFLEGVAHLLFGCIQLVFNLFAIDCVWLVKLTTPPFHNVGCVGYLAQ